MGARSEPHHTNEKLGADELFRRYMPFVARFLTHLGVGPHELEDVLQDVFVVVHARGGYTPGPAKPMSYLGSIAVLAAKSHRRKQKSARARYGHDELDTLPSPISSPERALAVNEALADARSALTQLDPVLRATLLLCDVEGESCLSVAASMQVPVGTVYSRLHRARALFQQAAAAQSEPRRAGRLTIYSKETP